MPEAKASGILVDGQPLLRTNLAFDLLTLEERQQQAIREHFKAIIMHRLLQVHAAKTESERVVLKTNASSKSGFTLVEIMIVVAIIGLLAAIAIPNFAKARTTSQKNACINNLRQIDGAAQIWALEFGKPASATYQVTDIVPYLIPRVATVPVCPAGGSYLPGKTVGEPPTCSLPAAAGHVLQ